MCERQKIKKATSVLTHSALSWWKSLTPSDKPPTWVTMKMLMRERFVSPNDAMPSNKLELSLLHDYCTSNSCDKKELCDNSSITYMPQLEHKLDVVSSNTVNRAKIRTFNPITTVHDELELLPSLNTSGYIEFDVLCNLNNLEEKLSFSVVLPWLSKHIYHVTERYNWKGEYMVHRVYICSNMKSHFVMKQHDQLEGYVKANHITSSSTCPSLYVLQQQGQLHERERGWMKSSALHQHLLQAPKTLSRGRLKTRKGRMMSTCISTIWSSPNQSESQAKGELKSNLFANLVWTARVGLAKTDVDGTYGLRFRRSRHCWKAKKIRFLTQLVPRQ
jgi:hypothetical protein